MSLYFDHHASAPVDPRVRAAMESARAAAWANPSSPHAPGRAARRLVEEARERIAAAVGASPADVVLTSGGTEACNLAVLGGADGPILATPIEHHAIAAACAQRDVRWLEMPDGRPPAPDALPLDGVSALAVQLANHETGTVFPVAEYAARARAAGVRTVVDAVAALGKLPLDVVELGAHAVALGSIKIGGPPGAGALWIARDAPLAARQLGGAQERGRRAGTPDVLALVGFGVAASLVAERLAAMPSIAGRRDRLERELVALGAVVNGADAPRVATVTDVSFAGWKGPRLVAALDLEGLYVSAGAACSSGVDEPSRVVAALAPDEPWRAEAAIRFSLGPDTSDRDVDDALAIVARVLHRKLR